MKIFHRFFRSFALTALFFSVGCSQGEPPALDDADRHFAAFYADYLVLAGVQDSPAGPVSDPGFGALDSLLQVHELTIGEFSQLAHRYQQDPLLWKQVLQEVRFFLKQKNGGALR